MKDSLSERYLFQEKLTDKSMFPSSRQGFVSPISVILGQENKFKLDSDSLEQVFLNYGDDFSVSWSDKAETCLQIYQKLNASLYRQEIKCRTKENRILVVLESSRDREVCESYTAKLGEEIVYRFSKDLEASQDFSLLAFAKVVVVESVLGLEAALLGIPVIVLGSPFYAGWGLTEDLQNIETEKKYDLKQCAEILFMRAPNFPFFVQDRFEGFILELMIGLRELDVQTPHAKLVGKIIGFVDEINLVRNMPGRERMGPKLESLLANEGSLFRIVSLAFILGHLQLAEKKSAILQYFRETFQDIDASTKELVRLFESFGMSSAKIKKLDWDSSLESFRKKLNEKEFEISLCGYLELIYSGNLSLEVFVGIAEIAFLKFDFKSAAQVMDFFLNIRRNYRSSTAWHLSSRYNTLAKNYFEAIHSMTNTSLRNPEMSPKYFEDSFADVPFFLGEIPLKSSFLSVLKYFDFDDPVKQARALMGFNYYKEALVLLQSISDSSVLNSLKYKVSYSKALRLGGSVSLSKELIEELIIDFPNSKEVIFEFIEFSMQIQDTSLFNEALSMANKNNIFVPDFYRRRSSMAAMDVKSVFESHKDMKSKDMLKKYTGSLMVDSLKELGKREGDYVLILPYFGPGDEIRYACFYKKIAEQCNRTRIIFGVEPRLHILFQRSFPNLSFEPIYRVRNLAWCEDFEQINQIPGAELFRHFDNKGWDLVRNSAGFIIQLDAMVELVGEDYSVFSGESYLVPDAEQKARWSQRLQGYKEGKILVGLCWRSSLNTPNRTGGYLSIDFLDPLFEMENIQFVNLQYGEANDELAELERKFPGRVINFQDIDLFNDLDGVAALISCLDCAIAPPTVIAELSGGLGVRTILLNSYPKDKWRFYPGGQKDIWHNSLINVYSEDKNELVVKLVEAIKLVLSSV